jgi:hypothetical protein
LIVSRTEAFETFAPGGEFDSFTLQLLLSFGWATTPEIAPDRVAEDRAEVGSQGVLEVWPDTAVTEEPLQVALFGFQPERQFTQGQAGVLRKIVVDERSNALASRGYVAVSVNACSHHLPHVLPRKRSGRTWETDGRLTNED